MSKPPSGDYYRTRCQYCWSTRRRKFTTRVPADEETRRQWVEVLGEDFGKRIAGKRSVFICRDHFTQLGSSGRRSRSSLPSANVPAQAHTPYPFVEERGTLENEEESMQEESARKYNDSFENVGTDEVAVYDNDNEDDEMHTCCHCGKKSELSELQQLPADNERLNQLASHYNLRLEVNADSEIFVCKAHLNDDVEDYEVTMESVADLVDDTINPETEFPNDVKLEMEDEEAAFMWGQPKEEPLDEDFNEFPFEAEANSFSDFDSMNSFQMEKYDDEQPTTSSHIRHVEQNNEVAGRKSSLYVEVSDTHIMSLCAKSTTSISGELRVQCVFCPETFSSLDTYPIRLHLHQRHAHAMAEFVSGGSSPRIPKIRHVLHSSNKLEADKALCRFFIANGLPLKTVEDRNLDVLAFNMNSNYEVPSVDTLFQHATEIAETRINTAIEKFDEKSPVTVTFDTTSFMNVNYLAFTVSYYQTKNDIKRCLFLREYEPTQPIVPSIISTIKQTVEDTDSITNIVTGRPEFEEALEKMECFQQVMVCFSQNMNRFANELIRHPVFARPLNKLREFVKTFPQNRTLWSSFKSFIVKRRTYGEFPEVDEGHWGTTLDFITKCLHMHRIFSDFTCQFENIKYIDVDDNINMVYLHSLLGLCKSTLKEMANMNATIASVIPTVIDIKQSIKITTSRSEVVDEVYTIFSQYLLPFVEQSDVHRFAVYLHPFHHGSSLLHSSEWREIQNSLARQLSSRESTEVVTVPNNFGRGGEKALKQTVSVDNEVLSYATFVAHYSTHVVNAMEFWCNNAKRFPRLYNYARELFQIPAFSVDAYHYLGEYGLITNSLQDLDAARRKTMLQAASELMNIKLKGELMNKTICVKRKRDTTCPEDAWYSPIDQRGTRLPDVRPTPTTRLNHIPHTSFHSNASVHQKNQIVQANMAKAAQKVPPFTLPVRPLRMSGPLVPKPRRYCLAPVGERRELPNEVKTEPLEVTVKQERQEEVLLPRSTRKYYAVRPALPNSRTLIPAINPKSRFLTGTPTSNGAQPLLVRNGSSSSSGAPSAKKMYFVRSKTGPQPPPEQPRPPQ